MANRELTKEEIINLAVNWWADKLKRPHHDNGDYSIQSQMAMIMADMGSKKVTEEQIEIFKKELASRIESGYETNVEKGYGRLILGCDYAPMNILSEPADAAGINLLNFPFKTDMIITKGKVEVSDGYAKPFVELS